MSILVCQLRHGTTKWMYMSIIVRTECLYKHMRHDVWNTGPIIIMGHVITLIEWKSIITENLLYKMEL